MLMGCGYQPYLGWHVLLVHVVLLMLVLPTSLLPQLQQVWLLVGGELKQQPARCSDVAVSAHVEHLKGHTDAAGACCCT